MTAPAGDGTGGDPTRVAVGTPSLPGRITYDDRVFAKIAEHTTAQVVGVPRGDMRVEVTHYGDGLRLRVQTPLPVPSLDQDAAIAAGPPVLDRVHTIQETVRDRVGQITGRPVVRVDVRVTGAVIAATKRVR